MDLLLADDLTGCCDSGIKFALAGLPVRAVLNPQALTGQTPPLHGMLAVNTDSRGLTAPEAARTSAILLAGIDRKIGASPHLVYKKLDSTLRGNPGAEIAAIAAALRFDVIFIAPAAPALGRQMQDGILAINGVPLAQTSIGRDPSSPMRESNVLKILEDFLPGAVLINLEIIRAGPAALSTHIASLLADGARFLLFDSTEQQDLNNIAQAGLSMPALPLFAGSAGLAQSLAAAIRTQEVPAERPIVKMKRFLFICGSANAATHAQIDAFEADGHPVLELREGANAVSVNKISEKITDLLRQGSVCVTVSRQRMADADAARAQIADLGAITRLVLQKAGLHDLGLYITGGETAYALLKDISSTMLLIGEPLPGVVAGQLADGPWQGLTVATKAGGFGDSRTMLDILDILTY